MNAGWLSRLRHSVLRVVVTPMVDGPKGEVREAEEMSSNGVHDHYRQQGLTERICSQLTTAGHDIDDLASDALAGVDEFHLGGRAATLAMLEALALSDHSRVLDVGCGIGGAARTIAAVSGCSVTGIDLTVEFVDTAVQLSGRVGFSKLTTFEVGNALALRFADNDFDAVTMFHVGMNISDKAALFGELARVLRPGGTLVVYDIMRVGDGELSYPVPWSTSQSTSFVTTPDDYLEAIAQAGLDADRPVDRLALVRSVLASVSDNPPPVNLSHLMGAGWPAMFDNLKAALAAGVVSPTQIVAHRPS